MSEEILRKHSTSHKIEKFQYLKNTCSTKDKTFKCCLCFARFKHFNDMILHATGYHKGEIEFFKEKPQETELKTKCTECDLRFISENSLRYHS